ncbi:hypothetical protein AHF37_05987 [Paragonimus kellicotti]|nr:hypothetical protein AHF37_05987 [Paragonimus kellicotti]
MRILNPKTVIQFLSYEKEEKVGFLWKRRSEHKGSFKKRYFVACGNILAYYEKKLDRDPLGVLILEGHVIEMLDDLTMALRFPTMGESSRSYVLRAESTTEIEQWMRVLSRSGIDFFTLTLEDLDDQLNAVTAVRKSISLDTPDAVSLQQTEAIRSSRYETQQSIQPDISWAGRFRAAGNRTIIKRKPHTDRYWTWIGFSRKKHRSSIAYSPPAVAAMSTVGTATRLCPNSAGELSLPSL